MLTSAAALQLFQSPHSPLDPLDTRPSLATWALSTVSSSNFHMWMHTRYPRRRRCADGAELRVGQGWTRQG